MSLYGASLICSCCLASEVSIMNPTHNKDCVKNFLKLKKIYVQSIKMWRSLVRREERTINKRVVGRSGKRKMISRKEVEFVRKRWSGSMRLGLEIVRIYLQIAVYCLIICCCHSDRWFTWHCHSPQYLCCSTVATTQYTCYVINVLVDLHNATLQQIK